MHTEALSHARIETHTFLFRRLIKCAACGRSLTGERQKGHVYYRCHDRPCRGVSLAETAVEEMIVRELDWLKIDDDEGLGDLRDLFQEQIARERAARGQTEVAIERDLGLIETRLTRLTDALIDGIIDKDTYDKRKGDLLQRKRSLQDRLENGENLTFWQSVSERFELGLTASSDYILASEDKKRSAVQTFGSNVVADRKTPYFPMQFPFEEIRNWSKTIDCDPTGNRTPI